MATQDALRSHQVERSEVMTQHTLVENSLPGPLDAPQSARPCTDTETSDPPGVDVAILRLNQEKEVPRDVDVYESLRDHQQTTSEKLRFMHSYLPLIAERFFGGTLPLPAISCERDRITRLGSYRPEDGLALCHRININDQHMNRPLSELLATLTHELGHQWQHLYGKPGHSPYHNKQFQLKMREIGIPCNKRGVSLGMQEPFVSFLNELGVEAEIFPFKQENQERSARLRFRLTPWACRCTRVWAYSYVKVSATCHECGNPFQRQYATVSV
jgi:SprT-like family protein